MRLATKAFVTSVGMGVLAISYAIGTQTSTDAGFTSNTASTDNTAANITSTGSTPDTSASSAPVASASASPSSTSSTKKKSTSTSSGKTPTASVPKKKKTASSSGSTGSGSTGSGSTGSGSTGSGSTGAGAGTGSSGSGSGSSGSGSSGSGSTGGGSASVTKNGGSINYRYGTIALAVTKDGSGNITDISKLQFGATNGRAAAWSPLVSAAKSANGSNFGNLSGATFTTEAFKQALDSALAKF